jgi:hypothetical protein
MEEQRLIVFEIGVLGRILRTKKEEVTGGWRKMNKRNILPSKTDLLSSNQEG